MRNHFLSLAVCLAVMALAPAFGAGQAPRAEGFARELTAHPRDPALLSAYGHALLRAGRLREAEAAFRKAARAQPRSPVAQFDVARVAFARGDSRAAKVACRPVERLGRNASLARVCRARAFLAWNRSARAFEELDAAMLTDAGDYEVLLALGDARALRADVDGAVDAYGRAAQSKPREAAPHLGLARVLAAAGRASEAVTELRTASELDPEWPEVLFELGRLLGGTEEARGLLVRAVEGRSDWPDALVALGEAELAASQTEAALGRFARAIELSPQLASAHRGKGRALTMLNRFDEAEVGLRKAIELVPNSAPSALALADLLSTAGRHEEALEQYRVAADLDPGDITALLRASQLALRLGRDVLAAAFLDRLLDYHEDLAAALALYGDVMRARGDRSAARDYYNRALRGRGDLDRAAVETAVHALESLPDLRAQGRRGR